MPKNTKVTENSKLSEDIRPRKQPIMVQFKTLLPWAIIYTMFVIGISFWAGWYYHGGYAVDIESKASAKADAIVTGLKAVK